MIKDLEKNYSLMFTNYPDIVDVNEMREMLGNIGITLAYRLLKQGSISSIKIGREYRIPKTYIIDYLLKNK